MQKSFLLSLQTYSNTPHPFWLRTRFRVPVPGPVSGPSDPVKRLLLLTPTAPTDHRSPISGELRLGYARFSEPALIACQLVSK